MPKKSMQILTESMFYVLMALSQEPMCGIDIADDIDKKTARRLQIGPATLYTVLGKFEKEKYIREIEGGPKARGTALTKEILLWSPIW